MSEHESHPEDFHIPDQLDGAFPSPGSSPTEEHPDKSQEVVDSIINSEKPVQDIPPQENIKPRWPGEHKFMVLETHMTPTASTEAINELSRIAAESVQPRTSHLVKKDLPPPNPEQVRSSEALLVNLRDLNSALQQRVADQKDNPRLRDWGQYADEAEKEFSEAVRAFARYKK